MVEPAVWQAVDMASERAEGPVEGVMMRDAATQAGAAAAMALATGLGPVGAALTFAGTFASGVMPLVWDELKDGGRRIDEMAEAATRAAGSVEAVVAAAESSADRRGLLADSLKAAVTTRFPPAVRAIGIAMAEGIVADDARLDDAQQVVEAMSTIQRPHFVVMWALRQPSDVPPEDGQAWFTLTLNRAQLLAKLPESYRDSFDRLAATLEREGLVDRAPSPTAYPTAVGTLPLIRDRRDMYWSLTSFGLRALALLSSVGGAEVPGDTPPRPDSDGLRA